MVSNGHPLHLLKIGMVRVANAPVTGLLKGEMGHRVSPAPGFRKTSTQPPKSFSLNRNCSPARFRKNHQPWSQQQKTLKRKPLGQLLRRFLDLVLLSIPRASTILKPPHCSEKGLLMGFYRGTLMNNGHY